MIVGRMRNRFAAFQGQRARDFYARALAARPDEDRRRLVADPSAWPSAIEELMRYESPVTDGGRRRRWKNAVRMS